MQNLGHPVRIAMRNIAIIATSLALVFTQGIVADASGSPSEPDYIKRINLMKKNYATYTRAGLRSTPIRMMKVGEVRDYMVPIGDQDHFTKVRGGFWIGQTEVTYAQWLVVFEWASKFGYTFSNTGKEAPPANTGKGWRSKFPVVNVSFNDAVIFCNALSELYGLKPVYVIKNGDQNKIIRSVKDLEGKQIKTTTEITDFTANGYRLPLNNEWEMAARWLGTNKPTEKTPLVKELKSKLVTGGPSYYWLSGNAKSGDPVPFSSSSLKKEEINFQHVCSMNKNALGLCDMTDNVYEIINPKDYRGGCTFESNEKNRCTVSYIVKKNNINPDISIGFRVAVASSTTFRNCDLLNKPVCILTDKGDTSLHLRW